MERLSQESTLSNVLERTNPLHGHEKGDGSRPSHDTSARLVWNQRTIIGILRELASSKDVDDSSDLRLEANAACL